MRTLIIVVFVKEADISLWDDAQHACPSFSQKLCLTHLRILPQCAGRLCLVEQVASPSQPLLWPGFTQLKYSFGFADASPSLLPDDTRSVGFAFRDTAHACLARRKLGRFLTSTIPRRRSCWLPVRLLVARLFLAELSSVSPLTDQPLQLG